MAENNPKLVSLITILCSIGIGVFVYFGFSFLSWKIALPLAFVFSLATYAITKYSLSLYYAEEQKKQNKHDFLRRQSDVVQKFNSHSYTSNSEPRQTSLTQKVVKPLDRPVEEVASSLARPAIGLQPLHSKILTPEVTGCWVGGLPKLPYGFKWPQGKDRENKGNLAMHFLAQIDCSQLPFGHALGLPKEGSLTFFVNFESIPQQCAVYYNTNTVSIAVNLPEGIKPIFPNKNVNALSKTYIKPIYFNSRPSFDHIFGTTHDNPMYQRPDWEDHIIEEKSELLEAQNRQAYDRALKTSGLVLPSNFKQVEPKVIIQMGGWTRGSQGDLPAQDTDFVLLSLAYDELTGIMPGDIGDINFVMTKADLEKHDFSKVRMTMN